MNHILVSTKMTSRDIAELTSKQHKDVLEAIRNMEPSWEKVTGRKFPLSEYKDGTGRKLPMYELSKSECLYVATKFNDEARARLIMRWEELENSQPIHSIPQSFSAALMLAATQAAVIEQQTTQIENQNSLIKSQQPKVLFADAVTASHNSILVGELAKILKQNNVDIGQNRLFEWLRTNKYLISRNGTDYNMPTQKSMELELFQIKETPIVHSAGHTTVTKTVKVTGRGQQYFINKFISKLTPSPINEPTA